MAYVFLLPFIPPFLESVFPNVSRLLNQNLHELN